ncbi:MAG: pyruvate kinase [bacterium]|nr:pyruvate kinase [bacterium]
MNRRAKIVATLGPASAGEDVLGRLLESGVDVVRLNMSHGSHRTHRRLIRGVRAQAERLGRLVPVIVDLMGPRYRLGEIPDGPRMLREGDAVCLGTCADASAAASDLPVEDPELLEHLRPGERLLIDNGLVELEVRSREGGTVAARVAHGGPVSTRKGINLPDTDLPFTISEKDRGDIAFALAEGADYLAVSFVGGPEDLEAVRATASELGGVLPLIAKLERAAPMRRLRETVEAADAVMVARGDLGVEVPLSEVPVLQKKIIDAGRRVGKPVIVATQMLESMMTQPRPTRAEASDCANAVFDGADALMLSGETAAGDFPVESVRTMAKIISQAETYRPPSFADLDDRITGIVLPGVSERAHFNPDRDQNLDIPDVVSAAAVYATHQLDVRRIVAFSQGGFTARMIARYRPRTPITVFTREVEVARRVQLIWGAHSLLMDVDVEHHDEVVSLVDRLLQEADLAEPGDRILILMGDPIAERPLTNLMRVHRVRAV